MILQHGWWTARVGSHSQDFDLPFSDKVIRSENVGDQVFFEAQDFEAPTDGTLSECWNIQNAGEVVVVKVPATNIA